MEQQSTPMIFDIRNTGTAIKTVEFPYLSSPNGFKATTGDGAVTMSYVNNSFEQWKHWALTGKAHVTQIYMQSGKPEQLLNPLKIVKDSVLGNTSAGSLNIVTDPYQKQNGIVVAHTDFVIDKDNHFKLTLNPKTTVRLKMYASSIVNSGKPTQEFKLPQIVKPSAR